MTIFYSNTFRKRYKKLDKHVRDKFQERVRLFVEGKHHYLLHDHSVDPPYKDMRSINITGDIRALYKKIDEDYLFTEIGTHSELYS